MSNWALQKRFFPTPNWEKSALRKKSPIQNHPNNTGRELSWTNFPIFGPFHWARCKYYDHLLSSVCLHDSALFCAYHLVPMVECLVMPPTFTKEQPPSRDADNDEALSGSSAHSPMGLWCQECFERLPGHKAPQTPQTPQTTQTSRDVTDGMTHGMTRGMTH